MIFNVTNTAKYIHNFLLPDVLAQNILIPHIKFMIIIMLLFLLIVIIEPEKIKFIFASSLFVLLLAECTIWALSIRQFEYYPQKQANWDYLPFLISYQIYSFEGVSTLFTIRSSMADPRKMVRIIPQGFAIIGVLYVVNALVFLLCFGDRRLKVISFYYYSGHPFVTLLEASYYIINLSNLVLYLISNCIQVEEIPYVKHLLSKSVGQTSRAKLVLFRVGFCLPMLAFVFVVDDEVLWMNVCGCLIGPLIGFLIPLLLALKHWDLQAHTIKWIFHAILLLLVTIGQVWLIFAIINNLI